MTQWTRILEELAGIAGKDGLKTDPADAARYAIDEMVPKAVVFPKNTKMAAAVMQCASRNALAVAPWGGGT